MADRPRGAGGATQGPQGHSAAHSATHGAATNGVPRRVVLAHGGASSLNSYSDGPAAACAAAMEVLRRGGKPLAAAVEGCALLEDDPRFNAGTGSNLRLDGQTIEMDASCMTSDQKFGAVASLRNTKNPVRVAASVHATPHNMLAGDGATAYARAIGMPVYDPTTEGAKKRFNDAIKALQSAAASAEEYAWDLTTLANHWNYPRKLKEAMGGSDTVGCVVSDGTSFAAASSTGGTTSTLLGRVGDVPLIGCGIYAGPDGAIAVTGDGDYLARKMLSLRIYEDLERGATPAQAVQNAIGLFPAYVDVGIILTHRTGYAGGSNRDMAWASLEEPAVAVARVADAPVPLATTSPAGPGPSGTPVAGGGL